MHMRFEVLLISIFGLKYSCSVWNTCNKFQHFLLEKLSCFKFMTELQVQIFKAEKITVPRSPEDEQSLQRMVV